MSVKTILALFGQALLIQAVISQCLQREPNCGCGYNGFINGLSAVGPYNNVPIPGLFPNQPMGISVAADNLIIDGFLDVAGNLPFTGVIVVDGAVPSIGQAEAYYSCGDGNVGITSSGVAPAQPLELGPFGFVPNYNGGIGIPAINVNNFGGCGCI